MELGAPGLETRLVRMEALCERHRGEFMKSGAEDDVWRLMPLIPSGNKLEAYFDHTVRLPQQEGGQGMAIISAESGRLIGLAAYLYPNRLSRRVRIGYTWLEKASRGKGLATHVQYLMIKRAHEWRARRVEWMMSTRSEAAIARMKRWNVQQEGVLRQFSRMADGGWADVAVFSIVGDEIRQMLTRLQAEIEDLSPAASQP